MLHCFYLLQRIVRTINDCKQRILSEVDSCSLFPCTSSTERYSVLLKDICFNIWFGHNRCVNLYSRNIYWAYCLVRNNMESRQYVLLVCFYCNTVIAWRLIRNVLPVPSHPLLHFTDSVSPSPQSIVTIAFIMTLQLKNHVVTFLASRKCQTVNYRVELLLHLV